MEKQCELCMPQPYWKSMGRCCWMEPPNKLEEARDGAATPVLLPNREGFRPACFKHYAWIYFYPVGNGFFSPWAWRKAEIAQCWQEGWLWHWAVRPVGNKAGLGCLLSHRGAALGVVHLCQWLRGDALPPPALSKAFQKSIALENNLAYHQTRVLFYPCSEWSKHTMCSVIPGPQVLFQKPHSQAWSVKTKEVFSCCWTKHRYTELAKIDILLYVVCQLLVQLTPLTGLMRFGSIF